MMKIAVIAKTGTIAQGRWVRLTGVQKDGIWSSCPAPDDAPTPSSCRIPSLRSARLTRPCDAVWADCEVEAGGVVAVDDDVTPDATGTVKKSPAGDRRCVVGWPPRGAMGKAFLMMLRWAGRP